MESNYIPYRNIIDQFDIGLGDTVYLASQVLGIAYQCRLHQEKFDADQFIDSICNKIGDQGTLFIPTFNWEFSNKGSYNYLESPCTTGSLGAAALKRSDFKRTRHPLHSFAVWGKDQEELCSRDNLYSFDEDSPFSYLYDKNAKVLMIGNDFQAGLTLVHYAETREYVPFRFPKLFYGTYVEADGRKQQQKYGTFARYLFLGQVEQTNRMKKPCVQKGILLENPVNGCECYYFRTRDMVDELQKDLRENAAGNSFDFEIDRELVYRYAGYGVKMQQELEGMEEYKTLLKQIHEKIAFFPYGQADNAGLEWGGFLLKGTRTEEIVLAAGIGQTQNRLNLSGAVICAHLIPWIQRELNREYTYRILFLPQGKNAIEHMAESGISEQGSIAALLHIRNTVSSSAEDLLYSFYQYTKMLRAITAAKGGK